MNNNKKKNFKHLQKGLENKITKIIKRKRKNIKYDTNTNANCLASLDKWDPPN